MNKYYRIRALYSAVRCNIINMLVIVLAVNGQGLRRKFYIDYVFKHILWAYSHIHPLIALPINKSWFGVWHEIFRVAVLFRHPDFDLQNASNPFNRVHAFVYCERYEL